MTGCEGWGEGERERVQVKEREEFMGGRQEW